MSKSDRLDELRKIVATCESCQLHSSRTQSVFGRGSENASIMVIGEAPGRDEDAIGEPFVGRAGQHLSGLLAAAGVPEDELYFANVLCCRPPDNKFPTRTNEPMTCRGYLLRQIEVIQPSAIILTGKQALRYVLLEGTSETCDPLFPWINRQCRRRDMFGNIRFLICYHPSYLMRTNNDDDEEAWIQAVAQLWSHVNHRRDGTAPAPVAFLDINPAVAPPRMGRNLFGKGKKT